MIDKAEVVYAVGPEVEHTPVCGAKTLFVNGVRSIEQMLEFAAEYNCKHVVLGAFDSFQKNKLWNKIIPALLNAGFHVSLHYPVESHEFLLTELDHSIWSHGKFIPVIDIRLPHLIYLNSNLMLKISDVVGGSNGGVWSTTVRESLDSNRFTAWAEYDNILTVLTIDGLKKLQAKQASK